MIRYEDDRQRRRVEHAVARLGLAEHDIGQVAAYVNHSRWVADCPCGGAELVSRHRDFLCGSCGGQGTVQWPRPRKQIEAALLERPVEGTRNWWPGETVAMLRAENLEAGI